MAYHPLTNETGQTPERRREEAEFILDLLHDYYDQMEQNEKQFWNSMQNYQTCSPKQLLWLRDLKAKYAE